MILKIIKNNSTNKYNICDLLIVLQILYESSESCCTLLLFIVFKLVVPVDSPSLFSPVSLPVLEESSPPESCVLSPVPLGLGGDTEELSESLSSIDSSWIFESLLDEEEVGAFQSLLSE